MKRTLFIALTILCCTLPAANSRDISFEHIDISNGLSQNTVQAIIQDREGFMWFGTKDGLNRFDGRHFKVFRHIPNSSDGLGNNQIRCLEEDWNGNILIGTNAGLYIYNPAIGTFERRPIRDSEGKEVQNTILIVRRGMDGIIYVAVEGLGVYCLKKGEDEFCHVLKSASPIRSLEVDHATGTVWFAWSGNGLFYTDDGFRTYSPYLLDDGRRIFPEDIISSILISGFNRVYLGLESNGVIELNRATRVAKKLSLGRKSLFVRSIMQYSQDELWIGTESGIFIWNIPAETATHLEYSPYDKWSLSDNAVHSLFKDRDSGIWIGTFFGGVNYLPQRIPDIRRYYNDGAKGSFEGRRVRRLCPDGKGKIWIASEDAGLFLFNPENGVFRHFAPSSEFTNIQTLLPDGDELWIGTFSKGIKVLNTKTSRIRTFEFVKEPGPRLFSNNIFALAHSSDRKIWVGTMHGLQFYDRSTGGFGYVPEINGGKMVNDILEDSHGNLWVGTLSNGLYLRRNGSGRWEQFLHDHTSEGSLPGNSVNSIFEDSMGNLWISVNGNGISRWNPDSNDFTTLNSRNGLPADVIYQIAEDSSGYFWLSSNNGLILINPNSLSIEKVFTVDNGLLSNQFNGNSYCQDENGNMYFGCIEGMVSFNPTELHWNSSHKRIPDISITDFSISEPQGTGKAVMNASFDAGVIELEHNQNTFMFQMASLTFSEDVRITFRMLGYDNAWRDYDGGWITYSNVRPGEYVFCVTPKDYHGAERKLRVIIRPPWWESVPALAAYILLAIGLLAAFICLMYRQQRAKREKYIKAFELTKEREVYDTKISFFTNVTHEIRTPLTLIKGPLDNILSKGNTDQATTRDLSIMKRNTDRLLALVNQLLDFQRIEKENLRLELSRENIPELLEEIVERFSDAMTYSGKKCSVDIPDRDIFAMVNRESMTKIISNLLTNAMKYSKSRITIRVVKDGKAFRLSVSNDGPVVPPEKRSVIFTQFYRHTNADGQAGTGIGLYLSKSLAELQNGTLGMTDDSNANEFVLTMPLSDEKDTSAAIEAEENSLETPETHSDSKGYAVIPETDGVVILVVEDDAEMRDFITGALGERWKTLAANNGQEAIEILEKENISLIVSDIMMPIMDGIELCRTVRSDIRFTHIPLVLLTAKTTLESKIEGMNIGADAYIEKPFSLPYLESVIANQLKTRQLLRDAFLKNPLSSITSVNISAGDNAFLRRLQEVLNENLGNPRFRMDDIAEMMNMSRANFYRKIKGVLDMSPNDYLRLERLRKAAKLLVEQNLQISEVSYMVGFNSPSYFTKCFHAQFGIHPKDFAAGFQKDNNK